MYPLQIPVTVFVRLRLELLNSLDYYLLPVNRENMTQTIYFDKLTVCLASLTLRLMVYLTIKTQTTFSV